MAGSDAALKSGFGTVSDRSKVSDEQEGHQLPRAVFLQTLQNVLPCLGRSLSSLSYHL